MCCVEVRERLVTQVAVGEQKVCLKGFGGGGKKKEKKSVSLFMCLVDAEESQIYHWKKKVVCKASKEDRRLYPECRLGDQETV